MDRGAWRARVHAVKKESDTTERLNNIMGLKKPGKEAYLLGVIVVEREQAVARLVLQTLMVKVQGSRTQGCKSSQEMVQGSRPGLQSDEVQGEREGVSSGGF